MVTDERTDTHIHSRTNPRCACAPPRVITKGPCDPIDGNIRICGDYKRTVNKAAIVDSYPIPRIEDLFASLAGGTVFSKLDLAHQLLLDDSSKELVVLNTHNALYRYNRLPFGVAAAPAKFQRTMESILRGLPNVCVYLDVSGTDEEAHIQSLEAVLKRLEEAGVRLKREKCEFRLSQVDYLGHKISAHGLQPTEAKVRAITAAPAPKDVSQLKAYLVIIQSSCLTCRLSWHHALYPLL